MAISALFSTNYFTILNSTFLTEDDTKVLIRTLVGIHPPRGRFRKIKPQINYHPIVKQIMYYR